MNSTGIGRILVSRKVFYIVLFLVVGIYIFRDYTGLQKDLNNLTAFMDNIRIVSERDGKEMSATFSGKDIVVREGGNPVPVFAFNVPTLEQMEYTSDRGNHVIFFNNGTIDVKRHTGQKGFIRLKSSMGFKKRITISRDGTSTVE